MQAPSQIGFMTYNICWSRRATGQFEEYSWANRKQSVYQLLKTNLPTTERTADLLFLQEIHQDIVEEVTKTLSEYKWVFAATNDRDGVCRNGIGVKANLIRPGEEFRSFDYDFRQCDSKAERVLGLVLGDICMVNAHFPMQPAPRMVMAENFNRCLPADKKYRYLIAGDFNSMPDLKGPEQMTTVVKVANTVCLSDLAVYE